ncbi:MAG: alpha/beta fold hydrolase [Dehalococcoidia bacterium]
MADFWRRHRALLRASYVALAFLFIVCVVPYLIPLGATQAQMSPDELVSEHGRFVDIDGVRIYVEEQNPQSQRATIVFIHGFGGSTFSWRYNVPFFAGEGYRVVSLDMKGFGLSHKDFESDYSHVAQARLLAEVLAETTVEQAYLVGHSMGTSVMLHFAHLYPEKVLGLVSAAGAINVNRSYIDPFAWLHFGPLRRAGEVFLTRYVTKQRIGQILSSAYLRQDIMTAEVIDGYFNRLTIGQWAYSLLAMTRDMSKNTIDFPLEDVAFPTLILWGENDSWVKRRSIDQWRNRFPAAEFHAIPEAGHLLMEEKPDLFNGMVLAFLRSQEGTALLREKGT